jgi:hypothetical protein
MGADVSGDELVAVVVVDGDGVDGTGPGGELRVQFGVLGHLAGEQVRFDLLAVCQYRLAGVLVALEGVPLGDALEHSDTRVAVVLDAHTWCLAAILKVMMVGATAPAPVCPRQIQVGRSPGKDAMCHGYFPHDHDELAEDTSGPDDLEAESDPSFLDDEASVESELLTDGGNEDEDDE